MSETADKPARTRKPNVGSDPTAGSRVRLWQVGVYAFAIGMSLVLILANVLYIVDGRFSRVLAAAAVLVIGLSWGVVRARTDEVTEPEGIRLGPSEQDVVDFVADVAAEVGAPMPGAVHLVTGAEFGLAESTRYFGRRVDSSALTIGLPFLRVLDRRELAALVAYELALGADLGVDHGAEALRALGAGRDLISKERQGFVNGVYGSYARKMFRSVGGVGVAQEEAADLVASKRYGTAALTSALEKYDDIGAGFDQFLREYVVPALQNQMHPSEMFDGFGELMRSPNRAEERARAVTKRKERERSEFELRLTPAERLERVAEREAEPGTATVDEPDAPAHTLLAADAKSEEIVVGTWATKLMTSRTEPHTWQELVDAVYSVKTQSLASMVFDEDIDAASQLEQAFEWSKSGDWGHVDGSMEACLKSMNNPLDRRSKWARCVVVEAAAATGAFNWQLSWDGPPVLVGSTGERLDAKAIGALIADGEVGAARAAFDEATGTSSDTTTPAEREHAR